MAYSFENMEKRITYTRKITLKGGRNQTIYYFAKDQRSNACDLPAGKKVVENERTGLPCKVCLTKKPRVIGVFYTWFLNAMLVHDACHNFVIA